MQDLAIIIVSHNDARWLEACLPSVLAAGGELDVDLVVVENGESEATRALIASDFQQVRLLECANHGFAHGCNHGLASVDARYVLFLNPDTEIVEGSLDDLVAHLDTSPEVGLAGCRQVGADGALHLTMRRFPTAIRLLMESLGSERWPLVASRAGQRQLDPSAYAREFDLDWTTGSFMLVRREALESAGWLDERLFLYCDDPDLARRIKHAGWVVRHLPQVVIVHHAEKMGWSERGHAQYAYANRIYFAKHFCGLHRRAAVAAVALGYGLRALLFPFVRRAEPQAARAMRTAFLTMIGQAGAPYELPPAGAVRVRPRVSVPRTHGRSSAGRG